MSELINETNKEMLMAEANRCLKCKVAKCQKACPISTDIPTIMKLFLDGKEEEAGAVLFENNPLSAICSIVCPHENNCNGNCILGMKKSPVDFYKIEQYLSGKYLIAFCGNTAQCRNKKRVDTCATSWYNIDGRIPFTSYVNQTSVKERRSIPQ